MWKIVHKNQEHMVQVVSNQLLDKLISLHYFEIQEIAIAPNDQEVIFVLGNTDMPHDEYAYGECNRSIWKCNLQNGHVTQLTSSEEDAHAPCWSPDSKKVAYLSRLSGKKELWSMNHDGLNQKQLTDSKFPGQDPFSETKISWSPDGCYIAYTVAPQGSFYGLWTSFRNLQKNKSQIQVDNGENKLKVLYQNARSTFESSLYIIHTETGINSHVATHPDHPFNIIDWFIDNKQLLVSNGPELKYINIETYEERHLYSGQLGLLKQLENDILLARKSGKSIEIGYIVEQEFIKKLEVESIGYEPIILQTWSNDGNILYFTSQEGVSNILHSIDVSSEIVRTLTDRGKVVWDNPTCKAGVKCYHKRNGIIFPYSGPQAPMELWELNSNGELQKLSNICNEFTPTDLPKVEVIQYTSNGWDIESLLVMPKNYDSTKKYPTLVYLHGGPESNVKSYFTELISGRAESAAYFLAEHGYAVMLPNFRGSDGYGEEFEYELANYKILKNPYEDVMAGVNYLIKKGIADPESLGIYGSSFGANLTAWTISQNTNFKGAIGAVGIYDQLQDDRYKNGSFHSISENRSKGTKPNDLWFHSEVYKDLSPMEHFEKINTPILFIETGAERELIGSYAKPLFNALLARGIKTNLVYYPEAFHNGGWNDEYKRDYMKRLVAWFDHCIKGHPLPDWFEMN